MQEHGWCYRLPSGQRLACVYHGIVCPYNLLHLGADGNQVVDLIDSVRSYENNFNCLKYTHSEIVLKFQSETIQNYNLFCKYDSVHG